MNKLLGKAVLFVSQIAMLCLWSGLIAWCFMFMWNQWRGTTKQIKDNISGRTTRPKARFQTIDGKAQR